MPRKKTTKKPTNGKANSEANGNTAHTEPEVISSPLVFPVSDTSHIPHVPHSIIALSVLISLVGGILINLDNPPRGWLTIVGIVVAIAGAVVYLGFARKIEGRKRIWTHVLWASVVLVTIYIAIGGANWLLERPREKAAINPLPLPTLAPTPTPSRPPSESASPMPQLPSSRILADGRIAIAPEYFTERRKNNPNLTMAQIQAMNNALIGKLILFSGVLDDAMYLPEHKDMHIEVKHESGTDTAVVADEKQMQQVELLQKGSPIALLCEIRSSKSNRLEFIDCEVMP